jgi:hypothetical protein
MKPSYEWDEQQVLRLIADQVEESISLDYKASASLQKTENKKNEIGKDVSAFANSVGGTIVYGVAQYADPKRRRFPEKIDGGYDPVEISKEWLEQVINSRIQPRIEGIRIHPIQLERTAPGKVIYTVSIPESFTAHQASDHRYYRRYNFESVPMEDYEVRLVMNKIRYPLLTPSFGSSTLDPVREDQIKRLTVELRNRGTVRAIDIGLHIWWPTEVARRSTGSRIESRGRETFEGRNYDHLVIQHFGSSLVIFPEGVYPPIVPDMGPLHIEYFWNRTTRDTTDSKMVWKVHAGDAPPQSGEVSLTQLNES